MPPTTYPSIEFQIEGIITMAEHSTLTGDDLHEPKGVAAASAGEVYVADGAASGAWTALSSLSNYTIVNSAADFGTPAAGVYTLTNGTTYFINGEIAMGTNRLAVGTGDAVQIEGFNGANDKLVYTGSSDFITVNQASVSLRAVGLDCANARLFNVTGTGTQLFTCNAISIVDCTQIGTFSNVYNIEFTRCFIVDVTTSQAIQFTGNTSVFSTFRNSILSYTGIFADLGSATFDSFDLSNNRVINKSGNIILDGLPSGGNINSGGKGRLTGNTFTGTTAATTNILSSDDKWEWWSNDDLQNSSTRGFVHFSDNTGATTITATSTYYDIATDTTNTFALASNSERVSMPSAGVLQVDSSKPLKTRCQVNMSVSSAAVNQDIKLAVFQKLATDTTGTWTQVEGISHDGEATTTVVRDMTMSVPVLANDGDQFKAGISNETGANNLTVKSIQFYMG